MILHTVAAKEHPYSQLWPCGLPAIMNTLLLRREATSPPQTTVEPLLSGYLLNSHPIRNQSPDESFSVVFTFIRTSRNYKEMYQKNVYCSTLVKTNTLDMLRDIINYSAVILSSL